MLHDFFKLNEPYERFDEAELIKHFRTADNLQNVLYHPDKWPAELKSTRKSSFKNVSLSKKVIREVTFTDCKFEDCLFIGTRFEKVQFHNCEFKNCNFYKADVIECYFDPKSVHFDGHYKRTAANVGVQFFQKLLDNSSRDRQPFFEIEADIKFRQWKRAQLRYDYSQGKIGLPGLLTNYIRSSLYEMVCGFGYRPLRFALCTLVLFLSVSLINLYAFTEGLTVNGQPVDRLDYVDSVFFTFSIMTVLGFSSIVPTGSVAKILTVLEALAGVGWMGLFTSLLVKRFLK